MLQQRTVNDVPSLPPCRHITGDFPRVVGNRKSTSQKVQKVRFRGLDFTEGVTLTLTLTLIFFSDLDKIFHFLFLYFPPFRLSSCSVVVLMEGSFEACVHAAVSRPCRSLD